MKLPTRSVMTLKIGRAFVFPRETAACVPGLRVSTLAVPKSSTKLRVVHDLTFSSGPSMTCVNEDTGFSSAFTCELGHVLRDIIWHVLYLRQRFGRGVRIVLSKMDVKDAFRQVPVEVTRAPVFGIVSAVWVWSTGDCNLVGATVQVFGVWLRRP